MLLDVQPTEFAWLLFRSVALLIGVWFFGYVAGRYHAKAEIERRILASERDPEDPE